MYCQSCGEELEADAEFCSACGTNAETDGGVETAGGAETAGDAESSGVESDSEIIGGLNENVAGALTYLFWWASGLLFYFVEEDNEFVRFHAVQSVIVFGSLTVVMWVLLPAIGILFDPIPVLGSIVGLFLFFFGSLLRLLGLVLTIGLMIKAYQGERYEVPVAGEMAKDYV